MRLEKFLIKPSATGWNGTHIQFLPGDVPAGQKTPRWIVVSLSDSSCLGEVKWFSRWRKYAFFPTNGTVFEETCMREISQFAEDRTRDWKS